MKKIITWNRKLLAECETTNKAMAFVNPDRDIQANWDGVVTFISTGFGEVNVGTHIDKRLLGFIEYDDVSENTIDRFIRNYSMRSFDIVNIIKANELLLKWYGADNQGNQYVVIQSDLTIIDNRSLTID